MINDENVLVLFDGVCNLCNGSVQFIIKRDPTGIFKFASLQSELGKAQLRKFNLPDVLHSIIVIEKDICYQQSDAAIKIARRLKSPWRWISIPEN